MENDQTKEGEVLGQKKNKKVLIIMIIVTALSVAFMIVSIILNKKYVVNFDTDGGSKIEYVAVKRGKKLKQPKNPTKEDYEFVEWQLDGKKYNFNSKVNKNIELKAIWKIKLTDELYTITFFVDDVQYDMKLVNGNGTVSQDYVPTKPHYKFECWTLNGEEFDFDTLIKEDLTLEAKFAEAEKYTLTLEYDGKVYKTMDIYEGETLLEIEAPKKEGYAFRYWKLNGKQYNENKKVSGDLKLEAEFEKLEQYEVIFNTDGGSTIDKVLVFEGDRVKKPANPTKEGYAFDNWQLNNTNYDFNLPVTQNIELKATWKEVKYCTVTLLDFFDGIIDKIKVPCGSKITKEEVINKSSKVCMAKYNNINPCKEAVWQYYDIENDDLTNVFDFNTPINSDFTIGYSFGYGSIDASE